MEDASENPFFVGLDFLCNVVLYPRIPQIPQEDFRLSSIFWFSHCDCVAVRMNKGCAVFSVRLCFKLSKAQNDALANSRIEDPILMPTRSKA